MFGKQSRFPRTYHYLSGVVSLLYIIVFSESFDIFVVKCAVSTWGAQKRHRKLRCSNDIVYDHPGVTDRKPKAMKHNIL